MHTEMNEKKIKPAAKQKRHRRPSSFFTLHAHFRFLQHFVYLPNSGANWLSSGFALVKIKRKLDNKMKYRPDAATAAAAIGDRL